MSVAEFVPLSEKEKDVALEKCPLFDGISNKDRERVKSMCSMRRYTQKSYIVTQGKPVTHVFILVNGGVQAYILHRHDENRVLHIPTGRYVRAGEPHGELEILLDVMALSSNVVFTDSADFLVFDRVSFVEAMKQFSSFATRILEVATLRHYTSNRFIFDLFVLKADARIAYFLLSHAPQPMPQCGYRVTGFTRETIAATLGISNAAVTKGLKRLEQMKVIRIVKVGKCREYQVTAPDKLVREVAPIMPFRKETLHDPM